MINERTGMFKFESSRPSQAVRAFGHMPDWSDKACNWRAFLPLGKNPRGGLCYDGRRNPESLRLTSGKFPFLGDNGQGLGLINTVPRARSGGRLPVVLLTTPNSRRIAP